MKKISDFTFVLVYILSVSLSTLLISSKSNTSSIKISSEAEISSEMSELNILQKIYPGDCSSSSSYNEGNGWSCENLYDGEMTSWQDNMLGCKDAWIEFTFDKEIYLEFIVIQNLEDSKNFIRNYKAKDILITANSEKFFLNRELLNDNLSQWIDINITTDYLRIDILSAYPGEEVNGLLPFTECAIQEINFYGRFN